ncbi:hypothetical protein RCL_jg28269.t1 [Rhizophagus clarus]|uniref:Uncharacterized protein n=1 Tax=Rhizophagus clarus TaxID=94130 RepID=A0A8H3LW22_9GLOM|nr:hypothetical protein RCL_jg28269.t1 [Rhizophagus clarus]
MENHVKVLKELILGEFSTIKFFKKIGYQFSQKAQARDNTFDEHMDSYTVELYWNDLKVQNERDKTLADQPVIEEKKKQHFCLIDSIVINEHNRSSNKLVLESSEWNLNDEIDNFFQSNPEQKSTTEENDDTGFFFLGTVSF